MTQHNNATADPRSVRTVRALGAQERLLYLYSKAHHRHFCVVGDISGGFGPSQLGKALQTAQMRHTQLSYAIEDNADGPHFIEHIRPIQVEIRKGEGELGWQKIVEAELAKPFDPWVGPLLRVTVVQAASDTGRVSVVLTFHHAIADGLSAVAFLNDLVSALNGNDLPAATHRPSVEELIRDTNDIREGEYDGQPILDKDAIDEVSKQPLWRQFEGDRPQVSSASFSRAITSALTEKSRKHGTTVHGALCAALTMANAKRHHLDSYSILSPINIRPLANIDPTEVGLFVSVSVTKQPIGRGLNFWELAKSYTDALVPLRSHASIVRTMQGLEQTLPRAAPANAAWALIGSRAYDAVISNLGAIDTQPPGDVARLEAVWGPMVLGRIRNERMIGAATLNGHLRLTEARPNHIPESLKRTAELLADAAAK